MSAWAPMLAELDAIAARGERATLWLRDDDAVAPTPALDRLLGLCADHGIPVLLAVIPVGAGPALAARLADVPLVTPCQHGFAHVNHAAAGARACELGARDLAAVTADLVAGQSMLRLLFGERLAPVLVPPWNRIDAALVPRLPGLGYAALSTFGFDPPVPGGPRRVDTHVDIIDWKRGRVGRTSAHVADQLAAALARCRLTGDPVGVLTHHLVHDATAWDGLAQLFHATCDHPGARWSAFPS